MKLLSAEFRVLLVSLVLFSVPVVSSPTSTCFDCLEGALASKSAANPRADDNSLRTLLNRHVRRRLPTPDCDFVMVRSMDGAADVAIQVNNSLNFAKLCTMNFIVHNFAK